MTLSAHTSDPLAAIAAQAEIHHAYLLGLQLMVATNRTADEVEAWMFRLFRQQHTEKFLSSFEKLGLTELPDAVACARYHVLSNSIGGVPVEYVEESPRKAWVRFRYPRWMYAGPTLCGVPVGVSRGFLRGWYAHNGVSLKNPRLGFVCVSEDMTGEFGFCGYFKEYDHDLTEEQRLVFAPGELPPPADPAAQPLPPAQHWSAERLQKAGRNYAVEYIRNGLVALAAVIGSADANALGQRAARLIGLQYYPAMAARIGARDGDASDAASFLATMFSGMGDAAHWHGDADTATVHQSPMRIARGVEGDARELLLSCWQELWVGAVRSHARLLDLVMEPAGDGARWQVVSRGQGLSSRGQIP